MKILQCDSCHVQVNDYAHWYNDEKPRNMYELHSAHTVSDLDSNTYEGMIICHKCIQKLLYGAEESEE